MTNKKEWDLQRKRHFGVSDVVVDFLGALLPGLLFSIAIALTLGSTLYYLVYQTKTIVLSTNTGIENIDAFEIAGKLFRGIGYFYFYFFLLILISSYVLGQFLYRKDPKEADTASFRRLWITMTDDQQEKWVEQLFKDEKISEIIAEFPYRFLKTYLNERGLQHLARLVPWDKTNFKTRSKAFINQLKIRIQFFYPDKMGDILKNEGHIRLMSSIWHLLKYLKILSLYCLAGNLLIFLTGLFWTYKTLLYFIVAFFLSAAIWIVAFLVKKVIESFFHYQRVREVFYVLETAYTASITGSEILKKIDPTVN